MNARDILKTAVELNIQGEFTTALRKLERLRAKAPHQPRVIYECAVAQAGLDNRDAAIELLDQLHLIEPERERGWQLHAELLENDPEKAIMVLERALRHIPEHTALRMQRAYCAMLMRDWASGIELLEQLQQAQDEESLAKFADLAISSSYSSSDTPPGDEPVVEDLFGATCFVQALELAESALRQLVEANDREWQHWYRHGEVQQRLQRFEQATASFQRALEQLGDSDEMMLKMIEQSIEDCADNGQGQRQRIAGMMRDAINEGVSDKHRARPDHRVAQHMVESAIEHIEHGGSLAEAAEAFLDDSDPDKPVVVSIAREILSSIKLGEPRFDLARPEIFPRSAQKHCDRCRQALREHGFRNLGDFMPRHVESLVGNPTLMRIMTSPDGTVTAACYQVFPRRPVWWQWLLLVLTRKWRTPRTVDLQTELSDGRFVVTNNVGDLDPFEPGPEFVVNKLDTNADIDTLLHVHSHAVADTLAASDGVEALRIRNIDDVVDSESRQQALKARHRQSVGLASESELKSMLGPQYPRFGEKVRQYLDVLSQRAAASH